MTPGGPTIAKLADKAERERNGDSLTGRLIYVIAECPTCGAERGKTCRGLNVRGGHVQGIHAERARLAANRIRNAP